MQFYWIKLVSSVSKIFMKRILCQSICLWSVTEESTVFADYQYRVVNYCSLDWQAAIGTSSRCDHYEILKSPHNVEKENRECNVCQHLYVWSRILYNEFIYVPDIYTKKPSIFLCAFVYSKPWICQNCIELYFQLMNASHRTKLIAF